MPQNSPSAAKPQLKLPELTLANIDPNMVRHGRAWREVAAEVEELLAGFPRQTVDMELRQELKVFLGDPPPATQKRREVTREAVKRTPGWRKKRLTEVLEKT